MAWLETAVKDWSTIGNGLKQILTTEIRAPELGTILLTLPILYICAESARVAQEKPTLARTFYNHLVHAFEEVPSYALRALAGSP